MPIAPLLAYSYPIVGVNLHPICPVKTSSNIFNTLKRAVKLNAFSHSLSGKEFCDIYIATQEIEKFSLFSFKHLDTLFDLGYRDAQKYLILE
jgi:NTE family protein